MPATASCRNPYALLPVPKRVPPEPGGWHRRARVAGGQDYEVQYEAKKTGKSAPAVKKAVKKVGNARKRVEKRLGR